MKTRHFDVPVAIAVAIALSMLGGCESDSLRPIDDALSETDTTTVRFTHLSYKGYAADSAVETGLEFQWIIAFESTTGRWLRTTRYSLHRNDALLVERMLPRHTYTRSGYTISAKETWVPISGPTPDGNYMLTVRYETGRPSVDLYSGDTSWTRYTTGAIDTTFEISL